MKIGNKEFEVICLIVEDLIHNCILRIDWSSKNRVILNFGTEQLIIENHRMPFQKFFKYSNELLAMSFEQKENSIPKSCINLLEKYHTIFSDKSSQNNQIYP